MKNGILMAGLIALAGCQPKQAVPDGAESHAQSAVHGRATYRERIAAPPGATLTVQLIDSQLADTPAAVIAATEVRNASGPPYSFVLPYDPGKLRKDGRYGLHASLRDAEGVLWFVSDTRVPVVPGSADTAEVRMVRASSSPWDQAKARGVAFRGIGTEPGWLVEVGRGESPMLRAELDYGDRKIDIARTEATPDGFRGSAADGTAVALVIARKSCNDGMSDATYPASATLTVDDKTYHGCGRFLLD